VRSEWRPTHTIPIRAPIYGTAESKPISSVFVTPKPWIMLGTQKPMVTLEERAQKWMTVSSHTRGSRSAAENPCSRGPALR
jgi:hypothetical protein